MEFDIDVSGEDIFNDSYTIVVANNKGIIRGFKFAREMIRIIKSRYGEGTYKYRISKQGKSFLRVRLYCVIIHYLLKSLSLPKETILTLNICRDFQGHEKDITSNLKYFLGNLLGLKLNIYYIKLSDESNADKYAYLMRKDEQNLMKGYVQISLEDIERYLIK